MKKQNYSVMITSILVKAVFVLIIVCCIFAPLIVRVYDNRIFALFGMTVYQPDDNHALPCGGSSTCDSYST